MQRDAAIIGAAWIERGRQHLIEAEMLHGDQPRSQKQYPQIAEARQHRQNGEVIEMGFDLPRMAFHQIDQQRGLRDQRHGQSGRDDDDRTPRRKQRGRRHGQQQ